MAHIYYFLALPKMVPLLIFPGNLRHGSAFFTYVETKISGGALSIVILTNFSDRKQKGKGNWKQYGSSNAGAHPGYELLMQRRSEEDNAGKEMLVIEKDRPEFERKKMRADTVQRKKDRQADMMKYKMKLEADLEIQKQLKKQLINALASNHPVLGT